MTITETTGALIPEAIRRGFSWVSDGTGCGAGFAPVRFRSRPDGAPDYLMRRRRSLFGDTRDIGDRLDGTLVDTHRHIQPLTQEWANSTLSPPR